MIRKFNGHTPQVEQAAFVAENATVLGDVTLAAESSVWYGAVLRADTCSIRVGEGSNVQDCAVVHGPTNGTVVIGSHVTIGHSAVIHGCTIGDDCLIGMGATLMNYSVIGEGCIIAAGALVPEGRVIPPHSLVVGVPGKVLRPVSPEQAATLKQNADRYVKYAHLHADGQE